MATAPIARKDVMELVLAFEIILLVRYIVEFLIKSPVGKHVVNDLPRLMEPTIIFCCFPCSRNFVTGRVVVEIVAD